MNNSNCGPTPTALYRHFGDRDLLIYIGITKQPRVRFQQESKDRWWPLVRYQTIQWYMHRPDAEAAEIAAIKAENPLFNNAHALQPPLPPPPPFTPSPGYSERIVRVGATQFIIEHWYDGVHDMTKNDHLDLRREEDAKWLWFDYGIGASAV